MKRKASRSNETKTIREIEGDAARNYPVMGTWLQRIRYVLNQRNKSLRLREIAEWIVAYEPGLTKDKSMASIICIISSTIRRKKVEFIFDRSNGNKRTRYCLHDQNTGGKPFDLEPVYPLKGTWPKKIEFILQREQRKLTVTEIVEYILSMQPELLNRKEKLAALIIHAINDRKELFCKEVSLDVRHYLYYLKNDCTIKEETDVSDVYPVRATWANKIKFILRSERRKLSQREVAEIILRYEPRMAKNINSLYAIVSYSFNSNKDMFDHEKKIGINTRYWLRGEDFDIEDTDYPIHGTWVSKVRFILKQEGRKLLLSEIVDKLFTIDTTFNNNKRLLSHYIMVALKSKLFCQDVSGGPRKTKYYLCDEPVSE